MTINCIIQPPPPSSCEAGYNYWLTIIVGYVQVGGKLQHVTIERLKTTNSSKFVGYYKSKCITIRWKPEVFLKQITDINTIVYSRARYLFPFYFNFFFNKINSCIISFDFSPLNYKYNNFKIIAGKTVVKTEFTI